LPRLQMRPQFVNEQSMTDGSRSRSVSVSGSDDHATLSLELSTPSTVSPQENPQSAQERVQARAASGQTRKYSIDGLEADLTLIDEDDVDDNDTSRSPLVMSSPSPAVFNDCVSPLVMGSQSVLNHPAIKFILATYPVSAEFVSMMPLHVQQQMHSMSMSMSMSVSVSPSPYGPYQQDQFPDTRTGPYVGGRYYGNIENYNLTYENPNEQGMHWQFG